MTRQEKCALLQKELTLRNFFEISCADPDMLASKWLEDEEVRSKTYGELRAQVYACAERIAALSFGEAQGCVGIAVDTCKEWPVLFWGLLAAGRRPVLLDPSLSDPQILHLIHESGANALITRKVRELPSDIAQTQPETLLIADKPSAAFSPQWADRIALCTSGTTATSRVYLFDGKALCEQTLGILTAQADHYITRESRGPMNTLCFLPLNHIFGLITNVIWLLFLGYPQVFLQDRSAETIIKTCRKAGVQFILAVPLLVNNISTTLAKRIARESSMKRAAVSAMTSLSIAVQYLSPRKGPAFARKLFRSINENLFGDTLELLILGGTHAPREHLRRINALGYTTSLGFGMTEVGVTSVEIKSDLKNTLTGSVGWPLPITEYKVRPSGSDPNTGELLIRTSAMHINRLEGGREVPPDSNAEGWYETGDVVRLGKRGRMYVQGRTKDMMLGASGENVYPDELEDAFADIEGVEQLSVLGMPGHETPYDKITLVLCVGDKLSDDAYLQALAQTVAQRNNRLLPMKRVAQVLATSEKLPVVNSIKVKRAALREMIEKRSLPLRTLTMHGIADEPAPKEPEKATPKQSEGAIRDTVRGIFANVLELSPAQIGDEAHFIDDLGGDSLQVLSISMAVEAAFSITIDPDEYLRFINVAELSTLVKEKLEGTAPQAPAGARRQVAPITRFEDTPEFLAFQQRIASLSGRKNPYFVPHDSALKDTSIMEGRQVLNFGSYNYVGMSGRSETMEAAKAAIDKYGTSASGSRLLAGEKTLYMELEKELADWKHAESALVLVGGHSTNVTLVGNFCGKDDLILYDALAHNSIQEGCRLSEATSKPFPHNDVEALSTILRAQRNQYAKVLIIIEGAYSMDGDIAPVPQIVALKKKYGCFLLVDEAHSACVIGKTGGGVDEHFGLSANDIDIKMGTLSKGLGTCGGYLAGSRALIEYLRYNLPGFVFSVGISPPLAAATLAAIRVLRADPSIMESLRRNIRTFIAQAHARGFNTCLAGETAVIPILVGRDEDAFLLSTTLSEHGVFVPPAVFPAVPKNKARLRFCVTSEHREEQIILALQTLEEVAQSLGISLTAFSSSPAAGEAQQMVMAPSEALAH